MTTPDYRFTGDPEGNQHERAINIDADSPHHTLGKGTTQAAAGDHKHVAKDITDLTEPDDVLTDHQLLSNRGDTDAHTQYSKTNHTHAAITDHGELGGLADDDHAAYPTRTGSRASGTWPINISGNAKTVDDHGHTPYEAGVIVRLLGPYSVNANSELTVGPYFKETEEYILYSLFHPSTYLFLSMPNMSGEEYTLKIRNTTNNTNHTGIYIVSLRARPNA